MRVLLILVVLAAAAAFQPAGPAFATVPDGAVLMSAAEPGAASLPVTNAPPPAVDTGVGAATPQNQIPKEQVTYKTPYEVYLTLLTVGLGVIFALLFCVIQWLRINSEEFSRTYILIVVVFAALFLIVAGYSQDQTAPVFGLLGSILGYLFGRFTSQTEKPLTPSLTDASGNRPVVTNAAKASPSTEAGGKQL